MCLSVGFETERESKYEIPKLLCPVKVEQLHTIFIAGVVNRS